MFTETSLLTPVQITHIESRRWPGRAAASHAAEIRYSETIPYSEYSQQQLKMVREISAVLCSST
jgi:hypothetical protein